MEVDQYSRIIFISIVDLQKIRFSKLEQVCDRVYVFVDRQAKVVPFFLVQQLQHLGESVKWVAVDGSTQGAVANHISFYLGKLHEQMDMDVEFAIISEDTILDSLIQYINEEGRGCIRVTRGKEKEEATGDLNGISWSTSKEEPVNGTAQKAPKETPATVVRESVIRREPTPKPVVKKETNASNGKSPLPDRVAKETIKRLVLSGNRPAALDSLKSYILLQYNTEEVNREIDTIIQKMEKNEEIKVKNEEVVYNF